MRKTRLTTLALVLLAAVVLLAPDLIAPARADRVVSYTLVTVGVQDVLSFDVERELDADGEATGSVVATLRYQVRRDSGEVDHRAHVQVPLTATQKQQLASWISTNAIPVANAEEGL